jgi:hypothetical protein
MIQEFLGQTNFAGRDGFYWWVGQVETQKGGQAKSDDRYKVRIVGQHLKDCNAVAYDDLPWAIVMMPATAPRREGGTSFQSVEYKAGDWVIGFFLDGRDGQQPVIMGSIGQQYKASSTHTGKEKPASDCLAFTTFLDSDVNVDAAVPATQAAAVKAGGVDGSNNPAGNKPDLNQPPNVSNEAASKLLLGTKCCNSETNPAGEYFCVEVADAKCESADNDKSKFRSILTELFDNIQNNGGQQGNFIVGKYTGKLYNYIGIAQGYANKLVRLANSIVARVKGEIFALLKKGVKAMIDFLLTQEVTDLEATNAAMNAAVAAGKDPNGVKPVKKKVGRLRGITAWINKQLEKVNCVMADLDDRLRQFIETLVFKALEQVINAARCFIDSLVNDILSKIASFLETAINIIMGPLQALLSIIASPLNILGAALKMIFDLLGITCGGPNKKCLTEEQLKNCTGPCGKKAEKSTLDDLLDKVENGNLDNASGVCSDAQSFPPVSPTTVSVLGGQTDPNGYSGSTPVVNPPDAGVDPTLDPNVFDPPSPSNTTDVTDAPSTYITPSTVRPTTSSTVTPTVSNAFTDLASQPQTIDTTGNLGLTVSGGLSPSQFTNAATGVTKFNNDNLSLKVRVAGAATVSFEPVTTTTTDTLSYSLTVDKLIVFEGETITFTLVANGAPVEDGTVFNYSMFGDITADDFFDKSTIGTMTMFGNVARRILTIANDALEEPNETVSFNVLEAEQSVPFTIAASNTTKKTTTEATTEPAFTPPIIGTPEVCDDGRIMDIPIIGRGDPYLTPPLVLIDGAGYGASAVAELDAEGYLSKIKVVRSGTGYSPTRSRLNCVVSGFVMISPGSGYYRTPTVYVNGKSISAKANIDSRGFVTGIEMVDKTQTYGCTPNVEIFGGNGLGAKAIPIMECRDDATFTIFQKEIAPSGTDQVIDCP